MLREFLVLRIMALFVFTTGCEDIFEKDISNDQVAIVSPQADAVLKNEEVSFVWEHLDGADEYEVAVVSASFDYIQNYICDTTIQSNKFSLILEDGEYEWSIQANNFGYSSLRKKYHFQVKKHN